MLQLKGGIEGLHKRRHEVTSAKARLWNGVIKISVPQGHVLLQLMGEFLQHQQGIIPPEAKAAVLRIAGQCYETWDMADSTGMASDMSSEARALLLRHEYWRRKSLLTLDKTEAASLQVELNGTDIRMSKLSSAGFAKSETTRFGMKTLVNRGYKLEFSLLSQTTRILLDDVIKALPKITGKRLVYASQPTATTTIDSTLRPTWNAQSTGQPGGDHFFCEISDERFPFAATVKDNYMVTLWLNTALGELLQATTFKVTAAKNKRVVHSCFQGAKGDVIRSAEPFVHVLAGCILPPSSVDAEEEGFDQADGTETKQEFAWHTEGVVVEIIGRLFCVLDGRVSYGEGRMIMFDQVDRTEAQELGIS